MDQMIRESIQLWLTFASPQEVQELLDLLLKEIGKRSVQPTNSAPNGRS